MKAIINKILEKDYKESLDILQVASNIILNAGTVIFPTETVYGLGANALDKRAASRIYRAKGRPQDNPLIVHISNMQMLEDIAKDISDDARKLIEKYWPGPLTMIFYKKDCIPDEITGGLETVAIRMPDNKIALEIISLANVPIAAPSANISGRPSITSGDDAVEEMAERVDMIILSDNSSIGIESTVVDMTMDIPIVLRPGKISQMEILETISNTEEEFVQKIRELEILIKDKYREDFVPKSPGMKYKHYSPNAKLILLDRFEILQRLENIDRESDDFEFEDDLQQELRKMDKSKIKVLTIDDNLSYYGNLGFSLGKNVDEIGRNLFKSLRDMDKLGIEIILCEELNLESKQIDFLNAIMNRLTKASENV